MTESYVPALLTRQDMQNSIDIYGYKSRAALSHVMDNVQRELKGMKLPPGYRISQEGDAKQGKTNFEALDHGARDRHGAALLFPDSGLPILHPPADHHERHPAGPDRRGLVAAAGRAANSPPPRSWE